MIELRYLIKGDGSRVLQYRNIAELQADRPNVEGYAHFTATKWKDVPVVKEMDEKGIRKW